MDATLEQQDVPEQKVPAGSMKFSPGGWEWNMRTPDLMSILRDAKIEAARESVAEELLEWALALPDEPGRAERIRREAWE